MRLLHRGVDRRSSWSSTGSSWLGVLCALSIVLLSAAAQAHGSLAPMCDPVGASVEAPIPALPVDAGEIRAIADCPAMAVDGDVATAPERLKTQTSWETLERALPAAQRWVGPAPERLPVSEAAQPPVASMFRWSVYRPPRL